MKTRRKKVLKVFISRKRVSQDFGLLVNKAVKLTEAFKYIITSVPLAVAVLNPTLYQPDKAG